MKKRLCKSSGEKKICCVCAGIANYFNLDPVLIRVIWLILVFVYGSSILAYIICAVVMPYDIDIEDKNNNGDYEYAPKD